MSLPVIVRRGEEERAGAFSVDDRGDHAPADERNRLHDRPDVLRAVAGSALPGLEIAGETGHLIRHLCEDADHDIRDAARVVQREYMLDAERFVPEGPDATALVRVVALGLAEDRVDVHPPAEEVEDRLRIAEVRIDVEPEVPLHEVFVDDRARGFVGDEERVDLARRRGVHLLEQVRRNDLVRLGSLAASAAGDKGGEDRFEFRPAPESSDLDRMIVGPRVAVRDEEDLDALRAEVVARIPVEARQAPEDLFGPLAH